MEFPVNCAVDDQNGYQVELLKTQKITAKCGGMQQEKMKKSKRLIKN